MNLKIAVGCVLGLGAVLYQLDLLFVLFTILAYLTVAVLGIYLGVSWTLVTGKQYTPPPIPAELQHPAASIVLQNMMEAKSSRVTGPSSVVTTRNMDLVIQDVLDLVLRDFISSWYKDLSSDQQPLLNQLQTDLWLVIGEIKGRLSSIDTVQLITKDVVEIFIKHFRKIRSATKRSSTEGPVTNFRLHPWLKTPDTEVAFLRKVSDTLLKIVLPNNYAKSAKVKLLLREVVANTMLKPTIDMICDPDYINSKLLSYIEYREQISEATQRTYTYAASYEDFIKIIEKCGDLEQLKQLRLNIMTEIMHATTINNLKKPVADKAGSPKGTRSTAKGELLKQRNLKRYINQLKVAKARSEKRISHLGGIDYKNYTPDSEDIRRGSTLPGQTVLTFASIMESATGRDYFETFLQREDNESIIGFWNAVLKLKTVDKRHQHHVATETYQRYISSSASRVKKYVDKPTVRRMEIFMKGDSGPEAFLEAQQTISKLLEEQHYPSFLVSDVYHNYITLLEEGGAEATTPSSKDELFFEPKEGWSDGEDERERMFSAQSYNAKQRLQQLDQKIINKKQALEAVKLSSKIDQNYKKAEDDLEEELKGLEAERRNLEAHIDRTTNWCENVGMWKAHIYESVFQSEGDRVPLFVIVIHLSGSTNSQNLQNSSQGWVVTRKLQDFYSVHEKLVQIVEKHKTDSLQAKIAGNWLKNKELPRLPRFTTVDNKFLKEAKETLNEYLSIIMKDERLAQSEALYGFLTPTPDYFQQPTQEKKSTFLRNILKNLPLGSDSKDTEEELQFFGEDRSDDRAKDSIAEPLYGLIDEVYELHGMFKWFRKSFIAFVEVTFGRSINRQLRETVHWIFSESMVIYYIRLLKDSMWPQGVLAPPNPIKSPEDKLRTRLKAKEKFLSIQPDAVKNLVGEENAKKGTIKMFEGLQDVRLNKQLLYMLLQLLLSHLDPELRDLLREDPQDETPLILSHNDTQFSALPAYGRR